ncbi:MAG: hypothetical protein Q8N09_05970 [Thermodesulfovibrionia bacterium]|nr:hypothetical protein [Thermodesulfovibrionia bacterium]
MIDSKQVTQRRKIFEDIITYILLATLIIAGIVSTYIVKSPARYWLYWLAAMGIWVEVVSKVTSKIRDKFEKFNIWGYLSVFILLPLTFINLYFNAKLDAANIIELKKPSNIEVSFDDNFLKLNKIDTKHLFLIGSNSNYMFFYDANSSLTYIAPLNMVKGITVKMNIS